jgi:DNA excision repair protein ERCC-2
MLFLLYMDLFPYEFRKNQQAIMEVITKTLNSHDDLVFESGTGSGKTICTLAATLQYALTTTKKIVYTTRTNAQQRQVITELRAIKKKVKGPLKKKITGVGIQGRANMCILARNNPEFAKGSADELAKLCSYEKKKAKAENSDKGCQYFRNFTMKKDCVDTIVSWAQKELPTVEEFIAHCEEQQVCPYEINKLLIQDARVVVVPYIYVFDPSIRIMLFDWLGVAEDDLILVVDEAHNLPDYIRELFSSQLSMFMLKNCAYEAEKYGDPTLGTSLVTTSKFCEMLMDILTGLRDTYIYGILENGIRKGPRERNDAFIPSHELETEVLSRLHITSKVLTDIIGDLVAYGEKIQEYRQKEGKLPRSFLHKLGGFLEFWMNVEMEQYIKLVVDASDGTNPRVEAYCVDPSVGTRIIQSFHASLHMSGTLEPLEEYRDSLGLPSETELVAFPSPFPKKNRCLFYSNDVTTRYEELKQDPSIIPKMRRYITDICNHFPKNTMVFFPSFDTLSTFLRDGLKRDIKRSIYVEEQGMSQIALMDIISDFKQSGYEMNNSATLFSVMGGRISEGMDFPAEELEIAVIVGIPYPKPTARQRGLQHYYELKFGKGWDYTVMAPTARKLMQAIGRLIRDENDRGVAVILDRRAQRFKHYIPDLKESKHLIRDIERFMTH